MATANPSSPFSYASDNPLAPEFLALERQKKMADLLLQKGQQQPQGEMVSGHYVAPSWAQQLNPLVNSYISGNLSQQNEAKTAELAKLLRGQNATETQDILEKQFGSPDYKAAVPYPTKPVISEGSDMLDNQQVAMPPVNNQVGKAPNPQAALLAGLNATGPTGQAIGQTLLAQKLKPPEEFNLGAEETRYRAGPNGTVQQIATGKGKEVVAATDNLGAAERLGFPRNPTLWTPQQRQAISQEVIAEHNRKSQKNNYTIDARVMSSMSAPIGTMLEKSKEATAGAYNTIQSADKILGSVDKAITGPMANQRVGLAQISNTLGLGTEKNPEALAASRQFIQNMEIMQLGTHVKGEGAVSDFERRLKAAASGGEISFTPVEIKQMAKTAKQTAGYTIQQHNTLLKNTAALGPTEQKLSTLYQINPPQNPNDVFSAADAIINNGKK